jgi:hypothetical protein
MVTKPPWEYVVLSEDVIWLLRAVECEGEIRKRVAASLVNRFAFLSSRGKFEGGLGALVQAYAAPVNPRRMKGGDIWEKNFRSAKSEAHRKKLIASSERRAMNRKRCKFSRHTIIAVKEALTEPPELPQVTDFAAHDHDPSEGLMLVVSGKPGTNSLYAADLAWEGYRPVQFLSLDLDQDVLGWRQSTVLELA